MVTKFKKFTNFLGAIGAWEFYLQNNTYKFLGFVNDSNAAQLSLPSSWVVNGTLYRHGGLPNGKRGRKKKIEKEIGGKRGIPNSWVYLMIFVRKKEGRKGDREAVEDSQFLGARKEGE